MIAEELRERLKSYLPPLNETSRLLELALHRLPRPITEETEEPAVSKVGEALGEYLVSLWYESLPEVGREIAVRLAPLAPLSSKEPSEPELHAALEKAEEIIRELPPSIRAEGCVRDIALLRERWDPLRGASLESRVRELLPPLMRQAAREEALRRSFHRMSLPLNMLSRELPAYLHILRRSGMSWPASSFGWSASEGRWAPPDWNGLEELATLLEREPTVERLARTVALAPIRRAGDTDGDGGSGAPAYPEKRRRSSNRFESRCPRIPVTEVSLRGELEPEELFLLRRRGRAQRLSLAEAERRPDERDDRADQREEMSGREPPPPKHTPPVALVLDTTGSMRGEGESVARAVAFGLLRHAVTRGRELRLAVFSTSVRRLLLRPHSPNVAALPEFLDEAFSSGAAAVPALREVLREAQREGWKEGDILFVTDSREARLSPTTEEQLAELRRRSNLRLHGLTVNEYPMLNPGNLFDFTWHYAGSRTLRPGISSEQFQRI
ncbi:MAG: vWA domain-containing protein [Spirochaetaceae bacterium]